MSDQQNQPPEGGWQSPGASPPGTPPAENPQGTPPAGYPSAENPQGTPPPASPTAAIPFGTPPAGSPQWGPSAPDGQSGWGPPGPGTQQQWSNQPAAPPSWDQNSGPAQQYAPPPGGYQQPTYPQSGGYQQQPGGFPPPGGGFSPPGSYPPGGGGWQQQPPPPPAKRTNPLLIIGPVAGVAAIVIGIVIALAVRGGDDKSVATATASSTFPSTAAPGSTAASAAPTPGTSSVAPGPTVAGMSPPRNINQTQNFTGGYTDNTYGGTITFNTIRTATGPVSSYGDPPKNGIFVIVNVTITGVSGKVSASPYDFSIRTADGSTYDSSYDSVDPNLRSSDLAPGKLIRGNIVFDVPQGNNTLVYSPLFVNTAPEFQY